jgi:tetraacyldisaccharide 4'-kinase
VELFARRWWGGDLGRGGRLLDALAAPLSWAVARAARRRAARLARASARVDGLRVVSVGNLAVGGTCKTPVAAWVVGRLLEAGIPAAVVTGASGRDEALLHERWSPGAPVLVGRDRLAAAAAARARGARAVVLDDGFQHLRIARDLDVVLLSAEDPFPGRVLPLGPYREAPEALGRADVLVVTRRRASRGEAEGVAERAARFAPGAATAGAWLAPGGLCELGVWAGGNETGHGRAAPAGPHGPLLAVCAIGRPDAFADAVRSFAAGSVELLAFPDHHAYGRSDLARIRRCAAGRPVIMTEKDAVKLASRAGTLGDAWVLTEELRWSWGEADVRERLGALAAQAAGR